MSEKKLRKDYEVACRCCGHVSLVSLPNDYTLHCVLCGRQIDRNETFYPVVFDTVKGIFVRTAN